MREEGSCRGSGGEREREGDGVGEWKRVRVEKEWDTTIIKLQPGFWTTSSTYNLIFRQHASWYYGIFPELPHETKPKQVRPNWLNVEDHGMITWRQTLPTSEKKKQKSHHYVDEFI